MEHATFRYDTVEVDNGLYIIQLVSQRIYYKNSSFMIRDVTQCDVSCKLPRHLTKDWDLFFTQRVSLGCLTEILRDKLREGCYTVQWLEASLQRCSGNLCGKLSLILLRSMLLAIKMLPDFTIARRVTPCNFACN